MSLRALSALVVLGLGVLLLAGTALAQDDTSAGEAYGIELSGTIDPATEGWIEEALDDAAEQEARLAVIELDTPGGLESSMRSIVAAIDEAPMPVVVYVAPNGARAGSAGVFITLAADVAVMAPQTNIGSASPIASTGADLDETLEAKITNDAAAFVRALATEHGRDPALAEQMVREATNVTAAEALEAGLIDLVVEDRDALLAALDGFEVEGPKAGVLETEGLELTEHEMPLLYEILQVLVNPNVAFLLILLGMLGLAVEAFAPGTILPGAIGALSLLLGGFGAVQLPIEAFGVALLALALVLIVAEAYLPTYGLLGALGIAAMIAGGLLLFDTDTDELAVSPWLVIGLGLVFGAVGLVVGRKIVASARTPIRSGEETLPGSVGVVRDPLDPIGQVFLGGALWRARTPGSEPIPLGYRVVVKAVDGLTLWVEPVDEGRASRSAAGAESEAKGAD